MTWERALEADARIAAKNSVLIRAALRQAVDFEAAFRGYQSTNPDTTLSLPQQRVRARSWAIINIRVNLEAFKEIIYKLWAEAWVLGDLAAGEVVAEALEAKKADTKSLIDWSKWKPGDAASALILKPPRAFQRLLESQGITWKGFSDTTLTDLGNAIGEAIELGLDARTAAKQIMNHVASPARALTIAITEQNRAISQATVNRYSQAGLQQMEWITFDPCKICAQNENVVVNINAPFPSGDKQPPAHPNCRCALIPVIPGFNDPANTAGSISVTEPVAITPLNDYTTLEEVPREKMEELENFQLQVNPEFSVKGSAPTEAMKKALVEYKQADYALINQYSRNPSEFKDSLLKRHSIEKAGEIYEKIANMAKEIDAAMEIAPKTKVPFLSFRGVSGDEIAAFLDSLTPGTIFQDDAFVSTSLNFSIARDFTTISNRGGKTRIMRIINPQNTKGIMLDAFWGTQGTEGEWLLPRGTKFQVINNDMFGIEVKVVE